MHETRNLVLVICLIGVVIWAFFAWFVMGPVTGGIWVQRLVSVALVVALGIWCWYALNVEDKLPNRLGETVGSIYYDSDGLSFMPTVRLNEEGQAELSLYYQNRFENYVQAVIHLRPPADSFIVKPGWRDIHFAFKADGGDFGVIHQPIAVPRHLQGEVVDIQVGAATRYPRSHGARLISHDGLPCGTFTVDWGQAFKIGVHEVSGEIELHNPCTIHLSMPFEANETIIGPDLWKQELIEAGPTELAVLT